MHDLRYAIRGLTNNPGFTLVVILTLALGIGANTAIFSMINELVLRPLPYPDSHRIVRVPFGSSYVDFADWMERTTLLEAFGGIRPQGFDLTEGQETERIKGAYVSGHFFPLLRAQAQLGRTINPEDDVPGGEHIVLISDGFWRNRLSADREITGKSLSFGGNAYRVIGVMPPGFQIPRLNADLWSPIRVESPQEAAARGAHTMIGITRLKPGVTLEQAQAEMTAISESLQKLYPEDNTDRRVSLVEWRRHLSGDSRPVLFMLLGSVGFVLLIAVTNISGLFLSRAISRSREIAIRRSLGAGRGRLIKQLLVESLILALLGGGLALIAAPWISDVIQRLNPGSVIEPRPIRIDSFVLLFTLIISTVTGILFGLFPALQATRPRFNDLLKEGARGSDGRSTQRLRSIMVIAELSLALVLLIGAGLLLRSFALLLRVDPGFDPQKLLTMNITLPLDRFREVPRRTLFFQQTLDKIASLPGVESVSMNSELPFGTGGVYHNLAIEGLTVETGREPEVYSRSISKDFFRTMNIPLRKGRTFTAADGENAPFVCIVNESMVNKIFQGQDPIGRRVTWARGEDRLWMIIVGVVADIRPFTLDSGDEPALYAPFAQEQQFWKSWMNVVVRTSVEPHSLAAAVRREVATVDRNIPVTEIQTMDHLIGQSFADRKFNMVLLGAFAGVALFLAGIGVYGVMAYSVNRRVHDLGIRMALGAQKSDILRLVVGQTLRLTMAGLVFGCVASFFLTRLVQNLLFGIASWDPLTLSVVSLLLALVAILASYLPARRASSVDPATALRYE